MVTESKCGAMMANVVVLLSLVNIVTSLKQAPTSNLTTTTTTTTTTSTTTTTTPSPIPPEDDGELMVSRTSRYCDWTPTNGPICNYTGTDQVVILPSGFRLAPGKLEVEIHNATVLRIYPTCVSWIQVMGAKLASTYPPQDDTECRTWLRLYSSNVDKVEHGVKDLTLIESNANSIRLLNQRDLTVKNSTIGSIMALSWNGYRSTVWNSTIRRVSNVVAQDSWYIAKTRFGSITPRGIVFDADEMSLINSSISFVATQGMTIVNGVVTLANVTISFMDSSAIEVSSPNAYLALHNITIIRAVAPCFVVLDRDHITVLDHVTIMGITINESSPFIHYIEDDGLKSSNETLQLKDDHPACSAQDVTLTCDFINFTQAVEVKGEAIQGYKVLEIHNTETLQVSSSTCGVDLHLRNVNATLPHFTSDNSTTSTPSSSSFDSSCNIAISAWNSSLNVVWAQHVTSLNLTDSTVKRLHGGKLEGLWLSGSSVEEVDKLEVSGQGAVWNNSLFLGPINVTLKAPLNSRNVQLLLGAMREGSLVLDHPGKTSKISGWRNSWMERHSLVVKRGSRLELSDVTTMRAAQEAVLLEEEATVMISNLKAVYRSYHVFSVASRDQVEFGDSNLREAADILIHVRVPPPDIDETSNFTLSGTHNSPFCRNMLFYPQVCDFSRAEDANVSVDLGRGLRSNRIIVKHASTVTLFPSCVEKVMLLEVERATTVEGERNCATWLEATGVEITNLTSGVHDLTLTSCTVKLLAPDRKLRDLDLENSKVERIVGVEWEGYMGVVNNSHLGRVEGLRAGSRIMVSNSTIDVISISGLILDAEAVMANTTFNRIETGAILINGSCRLHDVTIKKLATGAIHVLSGHMVLVNVRIDEADDAGIVAGELGGVSFQNVTVGGKRIHWRGYLTDDALNHSLVLRNQAAPQDSNPAVIPTTTSTTLPEETIPAETNPEVQTRKQEDTNASEGSEDSEGLESSELAAESESKSWHWAAAGIGFFLGIILASCVVFVVKVVKPNRGMLTLPAVLWKVRDDQHELLHDDQAHNDDLPPSTTAPTSTSTQGYTSIPSHERI